jgi:hypothetical protein
VQPLSKDAAHTEKPDAEQSAELDPLLEIQNSVANSQSYFALISMRVSTIFEIRKANRSPNPVLPANSLEL